MNWFTRLSVLLKAAAWADVIQKAKRLLNTGAVTVYHNRPDFVSGHVIGDTGDYNATIHREAGGASRTQWTCECKWGQYAHGRTRKWVGLEGRPCSHVVALGWKGQRTPYDDGTHDPNEPKRPFQRYRPVEDHEREDHAQRNEELRKQRGMPSAEDQQQTELENLPRSFTPDMEAPTTVQNEHGQEIESPVPNPFAPAIQRQHLELPDVGHPEIGMQPQQPSVTDPTGPTEEDPSKLPGAFSSVDPRAAVRYDVPIMVLATSEFHWAAAEPDELQTAIATGRCVVRLNRPVYLEQRGGKIPVPGVAPREMNDEGVEVFNTLDLGYHPDRQRRVNADEDPNGAPEQRGKYSELQGGRMGEAVDYEPTFKQVMVRIPLKLSGPLHPHYAEGWVDAKDVSIVYGARSPFNRRW